jgi:Flp pilus assembly protein TadD
MRAAVCASRRSRCSPVFRQRARRRPTARTSSGRQPSSWSPSAGRGQFGRPLPAPWPRNDDGQSVLRTALSYSPNSPDLHHALGLALTRLKRTEESLNEFQRAAELDPGRARYVYVYAVALHSAGQADAALAVLKQNLTRHPDDRDSLLAVVSFSREKGDFATALESAKQLARAAPDDRGIANLVKIIERENEGPNAR